MDWVLILLVLIQIESNGVATVGDLHLNDKAYGVLQIRQPYLNDVNRISGQNITLEQVHCSESMSRWCAIVYLKHWGNHYTKTTGLPLTPSVVARIHNGGPYGWRKPSTLDYEKKFMKAYAKALNESKH